MQRKKAKRSDSTSKNNSALFPSQRKNLRKRKRRSNKKVPSNKISEKKNFVKFISF